MNRIKIIDILEIMATADNGCGVCVKRLFTKFLLKYPDAILLVDIIWNKYFIEDYDEVDWQKEMNLEKEEQEELEISE